MKDIRVALVIFHAPVGQVGQNLKHMANWTRIAREEGAELICFPEMTVTGYCNHTDIRKTAQSIPGPSSDELLSLAQSNGVVLLAGMAEKGEGGAIYATHLVISPDGKTEKYRKLHLAPPEQEFYTAGDQIPVFEAAGLRFGIQLCYDAHFPELATRMAEQGAEAIFIPHASPRGTADEKHESWMRHLPARAFDNGLFILACNQVGDNGKGLNFPGNAVGIDPSGEVITRDIKGKEGVLCVDLEAQALETVRGHKMRYFFPNRRTDLYGRNRKRG